MIWYRLEEGDIVNTGKMSIQQNYCHQMLSIIPISGEIGIIFPYFRRSDRKTGCADEGRHSVQWRKWKLITAGCRTSWLRLQRFIGHWESGGRRGVEGHIFTFTKTFIRPSWTRELIFDSGCLLWLMLSWFIDFFYKNFPQPAKSLAELR